MHTLLDKSFEHDNCGIGAVVSIDGIRTHKTVTDALKIVEKLDHRAGRDGEGTTGDGVGILCQIPDELFRKELKLPKVYGVGMFFFPVNERKKLQAMKMFEVICAKENLEFLAWRKVPINESVISKKALDSCPGIYQGFVTDKKIQEKGLELDRRLYIVRRIFEASNPDTYVCSLSSRTIVYKGMFLVNQLRAFYLDLENENCLSAIALVHSRFSTNTNPSWQRAHPNRYIMHNGEINTIKGNSGKMFSREETMYSEILKDEIEKVYPVINASGSDSAMLDNTLEFMMMAGTPLPEAVMKLIPEPWQNEDNLSDEVKAFYEYNTTMMEPWDGPASIIFSDGEIMGAVLDRNGLRPSRYYVTKDRYLILSSEVGVLPVDEKTIEKKDRLMPGRMLLVDTKGKRIIDNDEIKNYCASRHPYGEWLKTNMLKLEDIKVPNKKTPTYSSDELQQLKKMFDYSYEDVNEYIYKLAYDGQESVISMGADIPLAVMSKHHQPLFNYFKQLFAQVTNPPFDSIREKIITSTTVYIGKDGNLLKDVPENCRQLKIENPILSNLDMLKIRSLEKEGFKVADVSILYTNTHHWR